MDTARGAPLARLPLAASPGAECIVRGTSPRGDFGHVALAVVDATGLALEAEWDPHPDETFIAPNSAKWALFVTSWHGDHAVACRAAIGAQVAR